MGGLPEITAKELKDINPVFLSNIHKSLCLGIFFSVYKTKKRQKKTKKAFNDLTKQNIVVN